MDRELTHLVEVVLRDSSNIDVILAMDRLVQLPLDREGLRPAIEDLERVSAFVTERVPPDLQGPAKDIFMEHVARLKRHVVGLPEGAV